MKLRSSVRFAAGACVALPLVLGSGGLHASAAPPKPAPPAKQPAPATEPAPAAPAKAPAAPQAPPATPAPPAKAPAAPKVPPAAPAPAKKPPARAQVPSGKPAATQPAQAPEQRPDLLENGNKFTGKRVDNRGNDAFSVSATVVSRNAAEGTVCLRVHHASGATQRWYFEQQGNDLALVRLVLDRGTLETRDEQADGQVFDDHVLIRYSWKINTTKVKNAEVSGEMRLDLDAE